MPHPRFRILGSILIAAGVIGVATGAVPLAINAVHVVRHQTPAAGSNLAAHGVAAMGLSIEWALLSSAMGLLLGIVLLGAGFAWRRGRASAPLITWLYVLAGLMVNVPDMLIFLFKARPGPTRSLLLTFDSVALALPILLAMWLLSARGRRNGR
jgi:hypothetical protein